MLGKSHFFAHHDLRLHTNKINSNKADLKLLQEMGIKPNRPVQEHKPTLKTVGTMIIATIRMRKMQEAWAGNKKLHETLMKKLEGMRKKQGKSPLKA